MILNLLFRILFVVVIITSFIAQFVLLILKIDRYTEISYTTIAIPAFIGYGGIFLWAVYYDMISFIHGKDSPEMWMLYNCLMLITGGAIISQALVVRKYDYSNGLAYWQCLLPFIFFFTIAGILYTFGLISNYLYEKQKNKYN